MTPSEQEVEKAFNVFVGPCPCVCHTHGRYPFDLGGEKDHWECHPNKEMTAKLKEMRGEKG